MQVLPTAGTSGQLASPKILKHNATHTLRRLPRTIPVKQNALAISIFSGGYILSNRGHFFARNVRIKIGLSAPHLSEISPPSMLLNGFWRRSLGHFHWWYHHVQEFAEASIRDSAKQDVPGIFLVGGTCCAVSVASFSYLHPYKSATTAEKYQLGFLLSALAFNLCNLFVFTPMTIEMMKQRHKVERELNIGEEVGWSKNQETAKKNPKLAAMNKKFGMIHGFSSLANIMSFGSLAMHSWYLAGKLNL